MGETTTNYGLYKPAFGEDGYDDEMGASLDAVDTELKRVADLADVAADVTAENTWAETQVAEKSWHFMGPSPWVDIEKKYGLVVGATTTENRENNADGINAAISDHYGSAVGKRLMLPAGSIEIDGSEVGLSVAADTSANLEIFGHGQRSTQIYQQGAFPGMKFITSTGNLRQLSVHDFTIRGSDTNYNLELSKTGYSNFQRIELRTGGGLHVTGSSFQNVLRDLWFLNINSAARAVLVDGSSEATLTNPLIGEDGGAIWVSSAKLVIDGGQMRQFADGVDSDGTQAMGGSHFTVTADGQLTVRGTRMATDVAVLCNIDNGIASFDSCRIVVDEATSILINQRTMTGAQFFVLRNNLVLCQDAASAASLAIYDQFGGTEPHDSIISGNLFLSGTNWSMTIEHTFFDPDNHNVYQGNTALETTGVTGG